jgi:hypothetical protein
MITTMSQTNFGNLLNPPYIEDYYKNVLKRSDLPPPPVLPAQVKITFNEKKRD